MRKGIVGIISMLCCIMLLSSYGYAETYYEEVTYKLGRGLTNVATCIIELGDSYDKEIEEGGLVKGLIFGSLKGVIKTVARAGAGVYDIVTFPIDIPKDGKSLIEPEFLRV